MGDVECNDRGTMPGLEMFPPKELLLVANECSLKVFIVMLEDHLAQWTLDLRDTPQIRQPVGRSLCFTE